MPIRDVVIFPHMMTPFVVGRESSVRALEEALAADKKIFLATQHDASIDEPKAERDLPGRHDRQHRAEPEAARRQHQGAGRRRRARQSAPDHRRRRLLRRPRCASPAMPPRPTRRSKPAMQRVTYALRAVREALPVAELRDHDRRRAHGRSGEADRHDLPPTCSFRSKKSRNCSRSSIPPSA